MKKYNITVNNTTYEVYVEEVDCNKSAPAYTSMPTHSAPVQTAAPKSAPAAQSQGSNKVTAPMPGTILSVKVSAGQAVKKGDTICVLEAMKMENDIPAPADGTIASVNVQNGSSVAVGDVIAILN